MYMIFVFLVLLDKFTISATCFVQGAPKSLVALSQQNVFIVRTWNHFL